MVACLLFVSAVNCDEIGNQLKRLRNTVISTGIKTVPIEMYYTLKDMKSLRAQYKKHVENLSGVLFEKNFDQELDELIEVYNINEGKCNSESFAKFRDLLQRFDVRRDIVHYLTFLMLKLGEFCHNMQTNTCGDLGKMSEYPLSFLHDQKMSDQGGMFVKHRVRC